MMIITWRILKRGSKIAKDDVTARSKKSGKGKMGSEVR